MQVREMMSRDVCVAHPDQALIEAARTMVENDIGALPVGQDDRLVGMLTDRDIVVRAVAEGRAPADCRVREAMTSEVKYVFEDENADDVVRNMATLQLRRLPVVDRDKRLVGIVAMADLARAVGSQAAGEAIEGVSQPG